MTNAITIDARDGHDGHDGHGQASDPVSRARIPVNATPFDSFEVGRDYTRIEIAALVGGSRRACLPTRDGVVVVACLLRSFNPDAPHVMLCGVGAQLTPVSTLLAAQRTPIPIFVKAAVNRWRHEGRFRVAGTLTSGPEFDRWIARSERSIASVSRVVLFSAATR